MHHIYCSQEAESWSGKDGVLWSIHYVCKVCVYKKCVFLFQDAKLRDVLGFGKGGSVERKLVTVVYGNDLVNISYLNFQAMQEDTAKVTMETTVQLPTHLNLALKEQFIQTQSRLFKYELPI